MRIMNLLGHVWTPIGLIIFGLCFLVGPFFTHPDYNWIAHPIGELAGQHMPNAWIMRVGFVALGFSMFYDSIQLFVRGSKEYLPFLIFGICLLGAGAFSREAAGSSGFVTETISAWHVYLFVFIAFSFAIGAVWWALIETAGWVPLISTVCAVIVIASGPLLLWFEPFEGLIDRFAWLAVAAWLIFVFCPRVAAGAEKHLSS